MDLVHEMTYHAMLRPPLAVGTGPFGTRMVFEAISGVLEGPRMRGKFVGAGGDWLLVGPDGSVGSMFGRRSKPRMERSFTCSTKAFCT